MCVRPWVRSLVPHTQTLIADQLTSASERIMGCVGQRPLLPASGVGLSLKINLIVSAKGTKVELARLK